MTKIIIFGNSGSGKSTLAKQLASKGGLSHLDLDTVAWNSSPQPERMPLAQSNTLITQFLNANDNWIVEGCYSDLIEMIIPYASEMIFLNLPVPNCIKNAKNRPWEAHKYESKAAQDANLDMLIDWISQYDLRTDTFSKVAHQSIYDKFTGKKTMHVTNQDN
ncbi:AAA family ATPase [Thalassomonas sp. M1454]|uniref:AAA family ATPase n=1 Tax=Thalassomonas sp. M1454 TaxID=2594477 RepID=UPI0011813B3E|nr:AAA family ATPase [Thalassomonas sp. M1454]TRX58098.1 AAA family ATPase [Thalassomonas sp. M1454]